MNSKKILIIIMAVVIVAIIGVLIWKGVGNRTSFDSTVPTTENPITTDTSVGGSIGKMTDDIYIEMLAQSSNPQMMNPNVWAASMKALYAKYGITEENITAYGKELENDPQRLAEIGQKYMQRAMELRNIGK